jgi:phosphoglycolate phosphatase
MQLVIFDCDGTLVDSQHNITAAMGHAFRLHGLEPPPAHVILGGVGLSLAEAFDRLAPEATPDMRVRLAEHYRSAFNSGRLERSHELLYPGIAETIAALCARDDLVLGMATGKSRRGVARVLAEAGWEGRFLTIQTADTHPSKPHPSMILAAMAEAGVGATETVMIGDTTFDIEMALAAAVGAIGVGWGYHDPARLADAGAHAVVAAGGELLVAIEARLAAQGQRWR